MRSYCVKQKKETLCVPGSERITTAKNGRHMSICICSECGITKTKFIREKTGGAISKSDFSCGYDLKGKRAGTAEECFKKGQVRRWGVEKLDDGYIDVLLADRLIDRNRKAKAKRTTKKKAPTPMSTALVPYVKPTSTPKKSINSIIIKPPAIMTPIDVLKLLDKYEFVPKSDEVIDKIDNIMNTIKNKKNGSTLKLGKLIWKKINNNEYQLNYEVKDDRGKPSTRNYITGSKGVIEDYLYKIDLGLIAWVNDRPVNITDYYNMGN